VSVTSLDVVKPVGPGAFRAAVDLHLVPAVLSPHSSAIPLAIRCVGADHAEAEPAPSATASLEGDSYLFYTVAGSQPAIRIDYGPVQSSRLWILALAALSWPALPFLTALLVKASLASRHKLSGKDAHSRFSRSTWIASLVITGLALGMTLPRVISTLTALEPSDWGVAITGMWVVPPLVILYAIALAIQVVGFDLGLLANRGKPWPCTLAFPFILAGVAFGLGFGFPAAALLWSTQPRLGVALACAPLIASLVNLAYWTAGRLAGRPGPTWR
jgi:hypothetical protein